MQLREYLLQHQESVQQFADRLNVNRVSVQRYKAGRIPTASVLKRIGEATGGEVTANDFLENHFIMQEARERVDV
tara:strand:+ start:276 stop:500 length:225 start_codon:yes stop_codon:yes gene_type:complete